MLRMEVPGSNSGKVLFDIFLYTFFTHGDCSIRVSRSHDLHCLVLLYNFVAVTLLLFKLSKALL